ncbi:hypothetical protein [Salinibacillus xinjiangensis]|uniref:hypothetical protein n=1 Tax=Salinibacillus xinjiangensis TaxID=1229268 RepID=UPI00129BC481|nr:hypothetical protein [Salinibacillus xinjiangensis]
MARFLKKRMNMLKACDLAKVTGSLAKVVARAAEHCAVFAKQRLQNAEDHP